MVTYKNLSYLGCFLMLTNFFRHMFFMLLLAFKNGDSIDMKTATRSVHSLCTVYVGELADERVLRQVDQQALHL